MSKVLNATLNQRVYETLLQMLLSGEIPMGEQLDERELSTKLGVSRTPLREAIASLVRAGLVEYFPYRGNYVKKWTAKQVRDLYLVRKSLEVLAIHIVTPKLSNEDIDDIRAVLNQAEEALVRGDLQAFGEADSRFHSMMVQKTENVTLIDTIEHLSVQIQMIRTIANRDANLLERTTQERPRILNALEQRDSELAAALMADHIEGVSQSVIMQLEEHEHNDKSQ
jgi:DNA-binding GntR family transcriptional regulator